MLFKGGLSIALLPLKTTHALLTNMHERPNYTNQGWCDRCSI